MSFIVQGFGGRDFEFEKYKERIEKGNNIQVMPYEFVGAFKKKGKVMAKCDKLAHACEVEILLNRDELEDFYKTLHPGYKHDQKLLDLGKKVRQEEKDRKKEEEARKSDRVLTGKAATQMKEIALDKDQVKDGRPYELETIPLDEWEKKVEESRKRHEATEQANEDMKWDEKQEDVFWSPAEMLLSRSCANEVFYEQLAIIIWGLVILALAIRAALVSRLNQTKSLRYMTLILVLAGIIVKPTVGSSITNMTDPINSPDNMTDNLTITNRYRRDNTYRLFKAYDCTMPTNVRNVGFEDVSSCEIEAKDVTMDRNTTIQVLQREKRLEYVGHRCTMVKTRKVRYCGAYDHQTTFSSLASYEGKPERISYTECKQMARELKYTDPMGTTHELEMNSVNILKFHEVGTSYVSGGEVKCQGGDWMYREHLIHNAVVSVQITLVLSEEIYLGNEEGMLARRASKLVPCTPEEKACETPTATYVWSPPKDTCPLVTIQHSIGTIAKTGDQEVFVSLDGTLVRLILGPTVSFCGQVVRSTNYPDIYIVENLTGKKIFPRRIRSEEISLSTYVNARDDYLYHHIMGQIASEVSYVMHADCQHQRETQKRDFWLKYKSQGYYTWLIGNDTFATSTGEVIYTYQCEPVMVMGLDMDQCYEGLPVKRLQEPGYTDPFPGVQLFMAPLTRRLTRRGIPTPCAKPFMPKYRNIAGSWTQATPKLHDCPPPESLETVILQMSSYQQTDFSTGGLYSTDELIKMEYVQDFSRAQLDLGARLTVNSRLDYHPTAIVSPNDLFPELADLNILRQAYDKAVGLFLIWGQISSGIFGLVVLGRGLIYLYTTIVGCRMIGGQYGCLRTIWYAFCPTAFLLRTHNANSRNVRHHQDRIVRIGDQLDEMRDLVSHLNQLPTYTSVPIKLPETETRYPKLPERVPLETFLPSPPAPVTKSTEDKD